MEPEQINLILGVAVAVLSLVLAIGLIYASISITSDLKNGRRERINASVFDSLLDQQARDRIAALPSTQAKHEALLVEYARLLPSKSSDESEAAVKRYLVRHGSSVNVQRSDLRREQGSSGYTDDAGVFVPLYAGGWDGGGGHGHDSGGFFDGGGDSGGGGGGGD